MVKEGLINLDFADVRSIMSEMGKAMMGTGEAAGDKRAVLAAEAAIANPLLDETSMRGARGLLISITGGNDLTLYEVDEAASRIRQEVDEEANIILGATFDSALDGVVRVSVVATGIDQEAIGQIEQVHVHYEAGSLHPARAPPRRMRSGSPHAGARRMPSSARRKPSRPWRPSPTRSSRARKPKTSCRRNSFRPRPSSRWFDRPACRRSRTCPSWRRTNCARCGRRKTASPRPRRAAGRSWRSWLRSASARHDGEAAPAACTSRLCRRR